MGCSCDDMKRGGAAAHTRTDGPKIRHSNLISMHFLNGRNYTVLRPIRLIPFARTCRSELLVVSDLKQPDGASIPGAVQRGVSPLFKKESELQFYQNLPIDSV